MDFFLTIPIHFDLFSIEQVEEFNWNLRHFLDVLANFEKSVNKANPTTIQLLGQTVDKLGNLLENVEEIEEGRNETIILSIDESRFDIKRSIYCRMCEVCVTHLVLKYIFHFQRNVLCARYFIRFVNSHRFRRSNLVLHELNTSYIRLMQITTEN